MAPSPQTLLALSPTPVPSLPSISLLPFSLSHDGPAPLSTFFLPRPFPSSSPSTGAAPAEHRQATFRGRRIVSSELSLPEGYRGLVFSTSAPLPPTATTGDDATGESSGTADRAAKRARLAAASAAALGGALDDDDDDDAEGGAGRRRSPRKGTVAASAAARARARAVQAARAKAGSSGGGGGAAARGRAGAKKGKGFSLDSDEEEVQEQEQEHEPVKRDDAAAAAATNDSPTTLAPPPAPLRTASALSTTSSSATLLVSTQLPSPLFATRAPSPSRSRSPSPSHDPLPASHSHDAPVALARDEKLLNPVCTFSAIEVWNPDWPVPGARVDEEDEVGRAVAEWVGVATKIHAY